MDPRAGSRLYERRGDESREELKLQLSDACTIEDVREIVSNYINSVAQR